MEFGEWKKSLESDATLENKALKEELEKLRKENAELKENTNSLEEEKKDLYDDCKALANRCRVFTEGNVCMMCHLKGFECEHGVKIGIALYKGIRKAECKNTGHARGKDKDRQ